MRVTYLVGTSFAYDLTDPHGISRVPPHARFALAEWGKSRAFVSFLPQSAPASAIVAVRSDHGAVRAGDPVHVVGFARVRSGNVYKAASGKVALSLVAGGHEIASAQADLDQAGAFGAQLQVPSDAPAGDAAILATSNGASGGATIHVDAVGDIALVLQSSCTISCPSEQPIALTVAAKRAGVPAGGIDLHLRVVRTPHVLVPGATDPKPPWGVTPVIDATVRTDGTGIARVTIPAPSDGLASTYGVSASTGGSTASTTLVAPNAKDALAVRPVDDAIDPSSPAVVDIDGFDALDGSAAAGLPVHVEIAHGPTTQDQDVVLDADGRARVTFHDVALGMNLVTASADVAGRRAFDAAAVTVAPRALSGGASASTGDLRISLDRTRTKPGDRVDVGAALLGAQGDAIFTMESVRGVSSAVVHVQNGSASASLVVPETLGATTVGVAFVRDGALVTGSTPLVVDAPGHQRPITLSADKKNYIAGTVAHIAIDDGGDTHEATVAVRVSDRRVASGASFDDVSGVLAASGTTTQNLASTDPPWHTWVAPAKSTAGDIFGFDRPRQQATVAAPSIGAARVLSWSIDRTSADALQVALPKEPGRYVLAVMKITDDGDVGSASIALNVQ
jgi:hypothetical protein